VAAREIAARIGSRENPNKGADLMKQMGWSEGQGLGAAGGGAVDPVSAAATGGGGLGFGDKAGLGVADPSAPSDKDDPFQQYKKRMMLGYKHRPNPLGNPRKDYY
jgi:splicing factor 4